MPKHGKRRGGGFIEDMFAAGVGAYAAKNSSSMGGLLWTLVKYAVVILVVGFAVWVILGALGGMERFTSQCPNGGTKTMKDGEEVCITAAGNVDVLTQDTNAGPDIRA
jgi:hypothetical protein